jgi:hypothetical protein
MMKNTFAAIGTALLSVVVFFVSYILCSLIIALLTYLLALIPILRWLIVLFYETKHQPYACTVSIFSFIVACVFVNLIISKLIRDNNVLSLTYKIYGATLAILGITFFVINIIAGDPLFASIGIAVIGIYKFFEGLKK